MITIVGRHDYDVAGSNRYCITEIFGDSCTVNLTMQGQIMTSSRVVKAILFSFIFTIFGSSIAKTVKIESPFISTPSSMGKIVVFHDDDGFHVSQNDEIHSVEKCWVDPSLQNISDENLKEFLVTGYISVSQMDNGEFSLKAKNFIRGGGPILAALGYFGTKALAYGTMLAAAAGLVGATGGAGAAAIGGAGAGVAAAGAGTATGIGTVTVVAAGEALGVAGAATVGTGTVAAVIGTSATATSAAVTVTGAAASTGAIGTIIAGIEAWALYLGALGLSVPGPI